MVISLLLLATACFGISIACMVHNLPNEGAIEIAQSRADSFGLKVVETRELENESYTFIFLFRNRHVVSI